MYYELYIDVFFLENFMLDSLLLMAVNRVMQYRNSYARHKNTSVWRWD